MTAVASLLIVIALSLLIVRIGTIALTMTGLSEDVAAFQSLSAFSGAGFTTDEAESVLVTRARRGIVKTLIRAGSVGVVTAISSLFLSISGAEDELSSRLTVLLIGVVSLLLLARSELFQRLITPVIRRLLQSSTTIVRLDYTSLLRMREGYSVSEIEVTEGSWLAGGSLAELRPRAEGVTVLGINRHDGDYLGAPLSDERFKAGDRLILYGRTDRLAEISERHAGEDRKHEAAKAEQRQVVDRERQSKPR